MIALERNNTKAARNLHTHGTSFQHAAQACRDPFANTVLYVACTERQTATRIISARRATKHEQDHDDRQNAP